MLTVHNQAIEPIYGEIYGREALIYFKFENIKSLNITMIDESSYQPMMIPCFDKIFDKEKDEHYILSTYDHVFDVIGQCEVSYK
ncbi:hypothetical protein A9G29_10815 [Gilliamella sp. Fer2-1]|nr:hypothetical protein A9G29_10815 [Gilliamella apicola]